MLKQRDRLHPVLKALWDAVTRDGQGTVKATIPAGCWNAESQAFTRVYVPVYQAPPKDLTPPFLCFRDANSKAWGSKTNPGEDFTVNFLVVSDYPGHLEAANIANAALVQLTKTPLDLSNDGLRVVKIKPGEQASGFLTDGRTLTRLFPLQIIVEDLATQVPQHGG